MSHISLFRPHATGAAPTFTVIIVTMAINKPSTTMKSAIIENRKVQLQSYTTAVVYLPDRLKDSAALKIIEMVIIKMPPEYLMLLFLISLLALVLLGISSISLDGLGCIRK